MMKKQTMKWLSLMLSVGILSSCGLFQNDSDETGIEDPTEQVDDVEDDVTQEEPSETDTPTNSEVNQDLTAWLPRLNNVTYHYEGTGNEFAEFTRYPQFSQDDYYQTTTDNGGTTIVEIYEYRDDEVVRVFRNGETYFRDNFSEIGTFTADQEEEIILKLPLEVGQSWENGDTTFEITSVDSEITVPAGTYKTIEVTATIEEGIVTKQYYAEGVGLVADHYEDGDFVIQSNLEAIEENTAEILPVTVYVADEQAMGMDVVEAEIALSTNDPARLALQELLSGQNENYPETNILPEDTAIQYLFLNNDRVVEIDVSEEFENMNAGSTGELFFIYNLVNTLSTYYGTDEVLLTVNGEPYSGAHMLLNEGETLFFNQDMVNE